MHGKVGDNDKIQPAVAIHVGGAEKTVVAQAVHVEQVLGAAALPVEDNDPVVGRKGDFEQAIAIYVGDDKVGVLDSIENLRPPYFPLPALLVSIADHLPRIGPRSVRNQWKFNCLQPGDLGQQRGRPTRIGHQLAVAVQIDQAGPKAPLPVLGSAAMERGELLGPSTHRRRRAGCRMHSRPHFAPLDQVLPDHDGCFVHGPRQDGPSREAGVAAIHGPRSSCRGSAIHCQCTKGRREEEADCDSDRR